MRNKVYGLRKLCMKFPSALIDCNQHCNVICIPWNEVQNV